MPRAPRGGVSSLTQWISVCSCDLVEDETFESSGIARIVFCRKCNKRIIEARNGSFTQWIFRSDLCGCEIPEPMESDDREAQTEIAGEIFEAQEENEIEIELDQAKFPKERFKPLGLLGQGAGGSVYLCRDRYLNKKVALKVLNYVSDEILVAFQSEARINTRLEHPNIARVLDFGIHEGNTPYMVVEYIAGLDLEFYFANQGPPDPDIALSILKQVCNALAYAHGQGVLHRDIKAGNILFRQDSEDAFSVSVIDFGLARLSTVDQVDNSDTIVGTPRYMSCDQARGLPYDQRSEIYSLGCLAFELFAGCTPFEAETALELVRKHALEEAPLLLNVAADDRLPEELEAVVAKTLAKDPENRYQSMSELGLALDEIKIKPLSSPDTNNDTEKEGQDLGLLGNMFSLRTRAFQLLLIPLAMLVLVLAFYGYRQYSAPPALGPTTVAEKELLEPHSENDSEEELVGGRVSFSEKEGFMHPDNILGFLDEDIKALKGKGYKSVSFYGINIDGTGLKYLKGEPIERLSLDLTTVTDESMKTLNDSLPHLKELFLEYTTTISGKGVANLKDMKELREITFNGNKRIDDAVIDTIVEYFPNLHRISLIGTSVTDSGVTKLTRLKHLNHIYLDGTAISDRSIEALSKFPLEQLLVSHTHITNRSLEKIARIKTLRYVSLAKCQLISPEGMEKLRKARPDLKIITKDFRTNLHLPF
ncbi:MAG: protein kinase [Candidatus Obscuribacterales bacterium]|nr:protein kinase [Candidatus Obscuribacterales bacterium]